MRNLLYCANARCDFTFEDDLASAKLQVCPKCGGMTFVIEKHYPAMPVNPVAEQMTGAASGILTRAKKNTEAENEILEHAAGLEDE